MKRLWDDPVAEILETVSPSIQRLWGFAPYIATVKVSKHTIRYDYIGAARTLGEFTIPEMQKYLSIRSIQSVYTWTSTARRKGLLSRRRINSTTTIFKWIGDDND